MNNDSQCKLILFYLKEYGAITAREAEQLCGCRKLYDRIRDLKRKGIAIRKEKYECKNTAGNKVRYTIYSLEDKRG